MDDGALETPRGGADARSAAGVERRSPAPIGSLVEGVADDVVLTVLTSYVGLVDPLGAEDDVEPCATGLSWLDSLEHPERGPVEWLNELPPSARLLGELESLPADAVTDDREAVEMVAHWQRMEAHCAAQKRLAAAELARRQAMEQGLAHLGRLGIAVSDPNIASDELGLRLGISRRAAKRLVASGRDMGGGGILVSEALSAGEIDAAKADSILDAIRDLPGEDGLAVQERVLDRAAHLPLGQVQRELNAACAAIDPAAFDERAARAAQHRRVDRPRARPHGMAALSALLPAADAMTLYRGLDAAARSAKSGGDNRTLDQLRADALAAMGWDAVDRGWLGPPAVVDETAVPAAGTGPGRTGGGGPYGDAQPARRGETCPGPRPGMRVGQIGGRSAHVRVVVPFPMLLDAARPPRHSADDLDGHVRHPEASTGTSVSPGVDAFIENSADDRWSDALAVAHLDGYGPIPSTVARALAAGSIWARMVIDPIDRTVLELTSERYQPPAAMADHVRAAQPTCLMPGCAAGADSCDLHHRIPWPLGHTAVSNLDPQCRRDHLLTTHGGWSYAQSARQHPEDGSAVVRDWRTAADQRYREHADGTLELVHPDGVPAQRLRHPGPKDPPPF